MKNQRIGTRLKALREEAGLSIRKMAEALGMPSASTYSHYETRYKKEFLPYDIVLRLNPVLTQRGIDPSHINALGAPLSDVQDENDTGLDEFGSPYKNVQKINAPYDKPKNEPSDTAGTIKIAVAGDTIQVSATIRSDEVDELIRRLSLARQMIE